LNSKEFNEHKNDSPTDSPTAESISIHLNLIYNVSYKDSLKEKLGEELQIFGYFPILKEFSRSAYVPCIPLISIILSYFLSLHIFENR